jgi:hypothetical protein
MTVQAILRMLYPLWVPPNLVRAGKGNVLGCFRTPEDLAYLCNGVKQYGCSSREPRHDPTSDFDRVQYISGFDAERPARDSIMHQSEDWLWKPSVGL